MAEEKKHLQVEKPVMSMSLSMLKNEKQELTQLVHNAMLDIYDPTPHVRNTGIVCTIGPASRSVDMLAKLMQAGMNIVRLNFSHGTHEYHLGTLQNARAAAKKLNRDIAIALDTKGPEIRTGNFVDDAEVLLELGAEVRLTTNEKFRNQGTAKQFFVDYVNIVKVIKEGDLVYIDDGLVSLRVKKVGGDFLDTVVENQGMVSNHKGVNLPNVPVDLPALSAKDKKDLTFGVQQGVDIVFASFIRKPQDIVAIRECLVAADAKIGKKIHIIAKIENHEGVQNFDAILRMANGIMVARGDLGIEIPPEKVFLAQKMMIAKCNILSKPIIVATQMLESMIKNPRPTRAEASDVANAVLDGADCVMLSGEVAKGKYPVESVSIMARICLQAEYGLNRKVHYRMVRQSLPKRIPVEEIVASSAVLAAFEQNASAIIVLTNSGGTARLLSKFRPACPIIAVLGQSSARQCRQLEMSANVFGVTYDDSKGKKDADGRVRVGIDFGKKQGYLNDDDFVVCVHADTMGKGFANLMRLLSV